MSGCASPKGITKKVYLNHTTPSIKLCEKYGHRWDDETGLCWRCGRHRTKNPDEATKKERDAILNLYDKDGQRLLLAFEKMGVPIALVAAYFTPEDSVDKFIEEVRQDAYKTTLFSRVDSFISQLKSYYALYGRINEEQ